MAKANSAFYIFFIIFSIFFTSLLLRPFELDESLHILAGKMIIQNRLNPFNPDPPNPFTYIYGSPIGPIIYGFAYLLGGFYLSRIIAMVFILASLIIVYKISRKEFGSKAARISLILAGISVTTILIASDALLDSISIFFLLLSLYMITLEKNFLGGLSAGFSILIKFAYFFPVFGLIAYLVWRRKISKFLFGVVIIIIPFLLLDYHILFSIYKTFLIQHVPTKYLQSLLFLLFGFLVALPFPLFFGISSIKKVRIEKYFLYLAPPLAFVAFHFLTLNYVSWFHHAPAVILLSSIIAGESLSKRKRNYIVFALLTIIILNLVVLYASFIYVFPSYSSVLGDIPNLKGRILSVNPYIVHLIRNTDLNDGYVYFYFTFDYNNDGKTDLSDYEQALKNSFFDYALIPNSKTLTWFSNHGDIENLVQKYYCTDSTSKELGLHVSIYRKCK